MHYVYIKSEDHLWTVGFYRPDGKWNPESDHSNPHEASDRVHYLNGGNSDLDLLGLLGEIEQHTKDPDTRIAINRVLPSQLPTRTPGFLRNPDPCAPPWEREKNPK